MHAGRLLDDREPTFALSCLLSAVFHARIPTTREEGQECRVRESNRAQKPQRAHDFPRRPTPK
ncbi:hypothetical protein WN51_12818 [Melipona quadrifasciata]|uniref:Uncharacterized protein n=1 Tax=Melipona quadrifasciata TaxID=166423 RepID=A0A0M9A4E2_9HYME|nr:hypothetical protein WN51_12818 [Melipona quadrifasciata]